MKRIILASGSPRRKELLEQCGVRPEIIASDINEYVSYKNTPEETAMSLSFQKAIDVASKAGDGIVIGADTLVVLEDEILGKPLNDKEAFSMLLKLSGKKHRVITGFSIIDLAGPTKIVEYESTDVYFRELSEIEISDYISTGESDDKAGAYGIQGKGALLVEKIEGCYFNVMGLPISRLNSSLKLFFNLNLL
ncbi:Maf family protein [Gudongella sp. DL1XJH-153]|uniref:Maf family protein n=1 Tax=Gudongella sp. DL1XJH-153 TaxID=3409804 RepID=UPI003BB81421